MTTDFSATAVAHSNIALVKYWGKREGIGNYPAVPSLALTLDAFNTRTQVVFDRHLNQDEFVLNAAPSQGRSLQRVVGLLDAVRDAAKLDVCARVASINNFPTASGLASSASGFAALALAAVNAAQLRWDASAVSALARACSASAARSIFGGWTTLLAGAEHAVAFAPSNEWEIALIVAVTETGPKGVSSTEAMNRCAATSPCYSAWLEVAPRIFERACQAIRRRDIEALGQCMEESTLLMHATMLSARPPVIYLAPATLSVINEIRSRRTTTTPAFFTTDAGAHVKVLTLAKHAPEVSGWLARLPGVNQVVICRPGPAAYVMPKDQKGSAS